MATYYRKLEPGERMMAGDVRCEVKGKTTYANCDIPYDNDYLRPVIITEAKPEPPAHRVEDETWHIHPIWQDNISTTDNRYSICRRENRDPNMRPGADERWRQRAKRICAGQEALKWIESHCGMWPATFAGDFARILAMLKEGK